MLLEGYFWHNPLAFVYFAVFAKRELPIFFQLMSVCIHLLVWEYVI